MRAFFGGVVSYIVVYLIWTGLEYVVYGKVSPSGTDSIIAVILAASIYMNIELVRTIKRLYNRY